MASAFYNDDRVIAEANNKEEGEEEVEVIEDVTGVFEVDLTVRTIFQNNYKLVC